MSLAELAPVLAIYQHVAAEVKSRANIAVDALMSDTDSASGRTQHVALHSGGFVAPARSDGLTEKNHRACNDSVELFERRWCRVTAWSRCPRRLWDRRTS